MPQGWTPDQIKQFQDYWDTEFAGDLAKRRRAKFVPGETAAKVVQTKEPQHKDDFDEWLARIICFAFSVPPQWATKAMNRATADNQSAQSEEEGLEPTKEWVKDLIDEIVAEEFASPDLELHWLDEDEGDPETVLEGRLKVGALTLNEMRDALGLDPFDNAAADRPMVLTATGFVPIEANAGQQKAGANGQGADAQTLRAVQKCGYSPDQPRVPAGNPDGGKWTNGGAQFTASAEDDSQTPIFGRSRGGHHFVPEGVFRKHSLKPETAQVFEKARTGSLQAGRHGWSTEHAAYNDAVEEAFQQFLAKNDIKPETMTPAQAQDFIYEVIGSRDPRIREFNLKIYRREIMYYIRRIPPRATE